VSNLRKIAPIAFTFACTLGFSPVPARAAYCGNVADTAAIERLIVADIYEYHFDRTWIEDIAVVGTFARADIAGKGTTDVYFIHRAHWQSAHIAAIPPSVFAALRKQIGLGCANPDLVEHPSG